MCKEGREGREGREEEGGSIISSFALLQVLYCCPTTQHTCTTCAISRQLQEFDGLLRIAFERKHKTLAAAFGKKVKSSSKQEGWGVRGKGYKPVITRRERERERERVGTWLVSELTTDRRANEQASAHFLFSFSSCSFRRACWHCFQRTCRSWARSPQRSLSRLSSRFSMTANTHQDVPTHFPSQTFSGALVRLPFCLSFAFVPCRAHRHAHDPMNVCVCVCRSLQLS